MRAVEDVVERGADALGAFGCVGVGAAEGGDDLGREADAELVGVDAGGGELGWGRGGFLVAGFPGEEGVEELFENGVGEGVIGDECWGEA